MERFDIGNDERLSAVANAVERGQEVLLTRNGAVIAEVVPALRTFEDGPAQPFDLEKLKALGDELPPAFRVNDAAALVREMRGERDF